MISFGDEFQEIQCVIHISGSKEQKMFAVAFAFFSPVCNEAKEWALWILMYLHSQTTQTRN